MTVTITENVLYQQDFVPLSVYIVLLIASMVFIIFAMLKSYKREGILFSVFALILSAFDLFASFYLRVGEEFVSVSTTEIIDIQTVCLSKPLLFLQLGFIAFCVILLWTNVANYTKSTLKLATKENEELKSGDGVV